MEPDGWFDDDQDALSAINITPLVDVALVLLIIFMITAPMMMQGADVRLPRTRPMDRLPPQSVVLTATADENLEVNGAAVTIDELTGRLQRLGQAGDTVFLRGDEAISYGFLLRLTERIKAAEMHLALVSTPEVDR